MPTDYSSFVKQEKDGRSSLDFHVEGVHCISCVQRIESNLLNQENVEPRVNLTNKKLNIKWAGDKLRGNQLAELVENLGYKLAPFTPEKSGDADTNEIKFLLRCLAVAAFASGNLMIITDSLWFSTREEMGSATRDFLHWLAAAISLPVIIYSGRPFFYSAWTALKKFHTNMDVPISLAIILGAVVSVIETIRQAEHVYYDSSVMLIFFLLIGRYLDKKMRSKAKSAAADLLSIVSGNATILENGQAKTIPVSILKTGMVLQVASGEKITADGIVLSGESEIDTSLITGETVPQQAIEGTKVFAGMINISSAITVEVTGAAENTMLSEIIKLMEKAEQTNSKYVRIADKVAQLYTPVVHVLALATFLGWLFYGAGWADSLLVATTVLIITCPCAMGLAVPVVQVLAGGKLFKNKMLLKSGDALEKLAKIEAVVFDKTGTLTLGKPKLLNAGSIPSDIMKIAASMASKSKHPLSQALLEAYSGEIDQIEVQEVQGCGLVSRNYKLGKASWVGAKSVDDNPDFWLHNGSELHRFAFADALRSDTKEVVAELKKTGFPVYLISGDRKSVVEKIAAELGIENYLSEVTPIDKVKFIESLNKKVLMVGDGLNDAAALKTASVSMSPSTAVDITQNAADIVFQGEKLQPILTAIDVARKSGKLVSQNFALSMLYNVIAVPMAVLGYVTPLIAAIAMSSSSIIVVMNSMRLRMKGVKWM